MKEKDQTSLSHKKHHHQKKHQKKHHKKNCKKRHCSTDSDEPATDSD
jgi:hypothetical protein